MNFKTMPISPLAPERHAAMRNRIQRFISAWHANFAGVAGVCQPRGDGGIDDVHALDYAIYEGLWPQYADGQADMIFLGACMLGQVLERRLRMRWCRIGLIGGDRAALVSDSNHVIVPIQEMVCHRLSADPQFDGFEHLFFDVFLSRQAWPLGSHPLVDCNLILGDGEFEQCYGYEVPEDIQRETMLLGLQDEEGWTRAAGLAAYAYADRQDWDGLRRQLAWISADFCERYGADWRRRIERQNANIFEDWSE
ncbi:MAG: hypothetical protein LBL59_02835 [Xanthomonadaceae bacterium]|nr:hypothetical protein [Xanthomonadaceae bacterium]